MLRRVSTRTRSQPLRWAISAKCWGTLLRDRNDFDDVCRRANQTDDGNGRIEGRQLATVACRQSNRIQVGDLLEAAQLGHIERRRIGQRKDVLPKHVARLSAEDSQSFGNFARACRDSRVSGIAQYADATVLGQRAGGPGRLADGSEPAMSRFVVNMGRVEQCDQHVYFEQVGHSVSSRS